MTRAASATMLAVALVASLAIVGGRVAAAPAAGGPAAAAAPPANLVSGEPARGAAIDPVLALLSLERLHCTFSEEKRIALLARPLVSTGTITFERDRGIARATLTPRPQHVVLTRTSLRIRSGGKTEDIPLAKSKDLKAFALVFPGLLRGDRSELERSFDLGVHGSARDWWALVFTPKAASLTRLVKRVVVVGRTTQIVSLQIVEASGDTTVTRLTEVRTNAGVSDTEIAAAFGAP